MGVASTKNIIAQLAVLITMALSLGLKRNLQMKDARDIVNHLAELPAKFESELAGARALNPLIEKYGQYHDFFYLGRNLLYGTAHECSLKLKELTYLHAECYSAGELKHGPLALVNPNMPTIVLNLE